MTLYRRTVANGKVSFDAMTPQEEFTARHDASALFGNDGGREYLLSENDATAIKTEWDNNANRVVVPASVLPWQLQAELLSRGILADAEALIEQTGGELKIRWERAPTYARKNPAWNQLGALMPKPLSPTDIDAIFIAAGKRV